MFTHLDLCLTLHKSSHQLKGKASMSSKSCEVPDGNYRSSGDES
jgi:hypothetical protein